MKTATYQIKMKDGSQREVSGTIVNDIWGIDKRIYNGNSSAFFLTHIPTGVLVTNARTKKALMEIANLSSLMDQMDLHKVALAVGAYWNDKGWKD